MPDVMRAKPAELWPQGWSRRQDGLWAVWAGYRIVVAPALVGWGFTLHGSGKIIAQGVRDTELEAQRAGVLAASAAEGRRAARSHRRGGDAP